MTDWPGQPVMTQPAPQQAPLPSTLPPTLRPVISLPDKPTPPPPGYRQTADGNLEVIPGGPADPNSRAGMVPTPGDTSKTGDDYLTTIDPTLAGEVKALSDGRRGYPTGTALKDPRIQELIAAATQYDPTLDASNSATRVATRKDFTSGMSARNITSINTALGHLGSLKQAADALDNSSWQTWNTIGNAVITQFGDPRVKNFALARDAVANELMRVFRGSGSGSETEIEAWKKDIDSSDSPEQLNAAITQAVSLLNSRLQSVGDQYTRGMGKSADPVTFLSPHAQAVFNALAPGGTGKLPPPVGPAALPSGNPPPPPPNNPGTANNPTNADIYANGLQWGDPSTGAFDRNAYISDVYHIKPGQEDRLIGFWTANAGNANLTPDAVKKWYSDQGIPAPSDADIQKGIADAQKGLPFNGFDTTAAQKAYEDQIDAAIKARGDNPESTGEAISTNLGQGITLNGLDEISGVAGGVRALAQGENPVAGYQAERDIQRREQDRSEAAHPVLAPAANIAGGLLTAPIAFGDVNTVGDAVKAGAALGGAAGFNSGRGAEDSLGQAALGAGAGAGLAVAGDSAASALASRAAAKAADAGSTAGAETMGAANRLNDQYGTNIQPMPADVSGAGVRNITGGLAKFPASAQPIIAGAKKVTEEAQKARDAIAATVGNPAATPDAAGETALNGALSYIKTSKTKVDALYAKARQLGGAAPVDLTNARAALDQNIAELSQTPGGAPALNDLKALRAEMDKPYPVEGVRQMRTVLRDRFMSDGLRSTDLERRVGQVADAAQQDVVDSLESTGKADAAQAYAAAANAHAARVGVIDNVLEPIIGKNGEKSAEQVFQALGSATKTKGVQLGKFLGALPQDDAATVRATLIGRLGQAASGQQNAVGDVFSLPAFLTHWNQMSATAKAQLFGGETRAALDDLAKVAQGTKEAQKFANFSNTGGVVGIASTAGLAAGAMGSPVSVVGALLTQYGAGRLLASPRFARWLVKMPKDPAAAAAHVRQLSKIATADAAIAPDILGLQRQLVQAFTPSSLAAQPSSETATTGQGTR